ncbi:MAG: hypothetical protein LBE21_01125 [Pseudomonadales bacterium]|jgi:hypothetical protein|nr:hypothetical protein [Pseudomonadales bacterium]
MKHDTFFSQLQRALPTVVAVLISVLLSYYVVSRNALLNDDAYGYLRAAELFQSDGLRSVIDLYGWYGYSILIAWFDPFIPGGILQSAHWLNAFSYALLVSAFIRICVQLHPVPSLRVYWFAALTILLFPEINEMRYFLIRDFAYWAFSLWSLSFLLDFNARPRWFSAALWCLCVLLAIAFRLEGLLPLVFVPIFLSLPPPRGQRWDKHKLSLLWGVLAIGVSVVTVLCYLAGINLLALIGFAYRYYLPLLFDLSGSLHDTIADLGQVLFTPDNFPGAENLWYGGIIIVFAYVFTVVVNLVQALTLPLAALLYWGWAQGLLRALPQAARPVAAYLWSSVVALTLFMFIMHFLIQRYAVLLCLVLMTQVPRLLDYLAGMARVRGFMPRFCWALGLFCVYYLADSFVSFGYSRAYMEQAIAWTRSEVPASAMLHTNDRAIAYGSGLVADYDLVSRDASLALRQAQPGDYLVLEVRNSDAVLREELDQQRDLRLRERFRNERGDEVRIYQKQAYDLLPLSSPLH